MRLQTLRFSTGLSDAEALRRVASLFEAEGVRLERTGNPLRSTQVRLPLWSVDPALYSRRNWVGINPVIWLTGISAETAAEGDGRTLLTLIIDRRRTILWLAFCLALGCYVALRAPLLVGLGMLGAFAVGSTVAWFLGPALVRKEVEAQLRSREGA